MFVDEPVSGFFWDDGGPDDHSGSVDGEPARLSEPSECELLAFHSGFGTGTVCRGDFRFGEGAVAGAASTLVAVVPVAEVDGVRGLPGWGHADDKETALVVGRVGDPGRADVESGHDVFCDALGGPVGDVFVTMPRADGMQPLRRRLARGSYAVLARLGDAEDDDAAEMVRHAREVSGEGLGILQSDLLLEVDLIGFLVVTLHDPFDVGVGEVGEVDLELEFHAAERSA